MNRPRPSSALVGLVLLCTGCATQLDSRDTESFAIGADELKAKTEDVLKQNEWTIVAPEGADGADAARVTKAYLVTEESGGPRTDLTIRYKELNANQSRATFDGTSAGDFNKWSLGIQGLANKSKATRSVTRIIRDLTDKVNGTTTAAPASTPPKP